MVNLSTTRTTGNSPAEHVADHNTAHAYLNGIDATRVPAYVASGTGIDPTGATSSSGALQARIDAVRDSSLGVGQVYVPAGTYSLGATGLTIHKGVDFVCDDQALFTYSGSGAAFLVDNWNTANVARPGNGTGYVRIGRVQKTIAWTTGGDVSSIGVKLLNVNHSRIDITEVSGFWTGVQVAGDANGTSYNNIYLGRIINNKIALADSVINAGWTNGNNYIGGALRLDSAYSAYAAGTRLIAFETSNGCTFTELNLEGTTPEESLYLNSVNNVLVNCRFEGAQKIHFNYKAIEGNVLLGGYGVFGPDQRDSTAVHLTYDAAMTSASTTLTSATAVWVSGDVGKSVSVNGAGPTIPSIGGRAPLHTTIASFTNGTTVVLTDAAQATVSAVRQITRRSITPNQPEIIDDTGRNLIIGTRGQNVVGGGAFGGDAAILARTINSVSDVMLRTRGINGNTYLELLADGRINCMAANGKPDGSTTVFPQLRIDPTTTSPLTRPAYTAGRGNVQPDVALARTTGNNKAWEMNAPLVRQVVSATQASAGTTTFNMSTGDVFVLTLQANNTGLTLGTATQSGQVIILEVVQAGAGSFTWTAPSNSKFAGGTKGTTATVAGHRDVYSFRYDGTDWWEVSRAMDVA